MLDDCQGHITKDNNFDSAEQVSDKMDGRFQSCLLYYWLKTDAKNTKAHHVHKIIREISTNLCRETGDCFEETLHVIKNIKNIKNM